MLTLKSAKVLVLATALTVGSYGAAQAADIVDTAVGDGNFTTLVAAVQAAELVDTLKGPGPFTVFAPNDDAFGKLPAAAIEKLLDPANQDLLVKLLTYHVVAGEVTSGDVVNLSEATTVEGGLLKVKANNGGVKINNAKVIAVDIMTDNGVIHVVDTVLLPKGFLGELNSR